jgi:hypothetical protein
LFCGFLSVSTTTTTTTSSLHPEWNEKVNGDMIVNKQNNNKTPHTYTPPHPTTYTKGEERKHTHREYIPKRVVDRSLLPRQPE